jgi:hypothetical protein
MENVINRKTKKGVGAMSDKGLIERKKNLKRRWSI